MSDRSLRIDELVRKYEFTDETKILKDFRGEKHVLHRIRKLSDSEIGGWIESEENLSHMGHCWVSGEAMVFGNAKVIDNAQVCDKAVIIDYAVVRGDTEISESARISGSAQVGGNAIVSGYARVNGNVELTGYALISDYATLTDECRVYGYARVGEKAVLYDHAQVYDFAYVGGHCILRGDAVVCQEMRIVNNAHISCDLTARRNLQYSLLAQCGQLPINGKVIAYKQVNNDLTSIFDPKFQYHVGEWAVVESPDMSDKLCAPGLHFGNADLRLLHGSENEGVTILVGEIDLEDIITVQGTIRCRKAFIKDVVKLDY